MRHNYILIIPRAYKFGENSGYKTNLGWNKVHWDFFSLFVLPLLVYVAALVAYFGSPSDSTKHRDSNSAL